MISADSRKDAGLAFLSVGFQWQPVTASKATPASGASGAKSSGRSASGTSAGRGGTMARPNCSASL